MLHLPSVEPPELLWTTTTSDESNQSTHPEAAFRSRRPMMFRLPSILATRQLWYQNPDHEMNQKYINRIIPSSPSSHHHLSYPSPRLRQPSISFSLHIRLESIHITPTNHRLNPLTTTKPPSHHPIAPSTNPHHALLPRPQPPQNAHRHPKPPSNLKRPKHHPLPHQQPHRHLRHDLTHQNRR